MFDPILKADQLILGDPASPVVVCCLWTPRERVSTILEPSDYAAIGNLYSARRGLEFLIRNLLANPDITDLVITGADRSGSGKALVDLWANGVSMKTRGDGTTYWQVLSEVQAELDGTIPLKAIKALQEGINIWGPYRLNNLADRLKNLYGETPPRRTMYLFETTPPTRQRSWPVPSIGQTIRGEQVEEVWVRILGHIMRQGTLSGTHYGSQQLEVLNLVSVIEGSVPPFARDSIPEWLPVTADQLEAYIPTVVGEEPSDGEVKYTYSDRIRHHFQRDQVKDVVNKLVRDGDSRSAVISLWDSSADNLRSGSPCLNHLWFRLRDNTLYLTATIRSNDMFSAWPLNAYSLRHLQWMVLKDIEQELQNLDPEAAVTLGPLTIVSESAHIYDDCWDAADETVMAHLAEAAWKEHRKFADPAGSFVVSYSDDPYEVRLQHLTPGDGSVVEEITLPLLFQKPDLTPLIESGIALDTDHALYLGVEITRAGRFGPDYRQDA